MNSIFELFFEDGVPALLCARGSYVAAVNGEALRVFDSSAEGERLCEFMTPLDALRFQASFESRSPLSVLILKLNNYRGFKAAAVVFQRIMSRRFAVVWLFETAEKCESFCECINIGPDVGRNIDALSRFMSLLTSIPEKLLDEGARYGLLDLKAATRRCVDDIKNYCGNMDCIVDITENDDMMARECSPVPIPLGCFMQMISSMLLCMSDISQSRIIGVRLCGYGDESEIRMSVDALRLSVNARDIDSLIKELPSCAVYLSIGEFAAGVSGCELSLRRSEDFETVTLILSFRREPFGAVDFKSRDQFAYYAEELEALSEQLNRLITLRREAEPEAE